MNNLNPQFKFTTMNQNSAYKALVNKTRSINDMIYSKKFSLDYYIIDYMKCKENHNEIITLQKRIAQCPIIPEEVKSSYIKWMNDDLENFNNIAQAILAYINDQSNNFSSKQVNSITKKVNRRIEMMNSIK